MKKLTLLVVFAVFSAINLVNAQSVDDLKAMKSEKMAAADAILGEVADLQKQIDEFPGWQYGGVGILGFDLNSNSNWFAIGNPNSASSGYGLSASAFANKNASGYFWRNLLTLNLKRVNTTLNTNFDTDVAGNNVKATTDALDISSLYGKKLNEKWAISVEGKYTSTLLNFNRPGKGTLSAGATWTPMNNLVVLIHPLGYEKNWPGDLVSAIGAKIGASYAATIIPGVAWSSNLSAFLPYGGGDATFNQHPTTVSGADRNALTTEFDLGADAIASTSALPFGGSDLMNWTWINSFSTNIFKGIGVGLNVGLRNDKQIAGQSQIQTFSDAAAFTIDDIDSALQLYYSLGLSYTL